MNSELFPTKRNLTLAKRNLAFANQGHDLLDKKYKVLLRELSVIKSSASQFKCQFEKALQSAKTLLVTAQTEVGDKALKKITESQPIDISVRISYRNVMGATIPKIECDAKKHTIPPYSLCDSTASLDEAFFAWQHVKFLLVKLIETETAAQRIHMQLQKAKKRAAALENIIIPAYQLQIKYISAQLEERERDELTRIKKSLASNECQI